MITPDQEQYIFKFLSIYDMDKVEKSLDAMSVSLDEYVKEALFRDAVVSYMRPFSGNRGIHIKRGLRLHVEIIPTELEAAHKEVEEIRDQLFAHNDLSYQNPSFGPGTGFSIKGYNKVFCQHLHDPLRQLARTVKHQLEKDTVDFIENGL